MTTAVETLKAGHRTTWAAGDYAAVAEMIDVVAPDQLVARAGVTANQDVLDVATGTGNIALRAAATGARVVGLDLTPELFGPARQREAEWNVEIDWVEGDAEALPFADESFDVVLSAFGVQFAPRHEVVAGELMRVSRTGGTIAVCSWTPQGAIGELFAILGRYMPPAPSFATPPPRWGDEEHVRTLFTGTGADVELEFERHTTPFDFDSAEHWVGFMETCYGPLLKARERLTSEGTWEECRGSIVEMMDRRNEATDGRLLVPSEYLVAVAHKR